MQEVDMVPAFRGGDFGTGLLHGVNAVEQRIHKQGGRHVDSFAAGGGFGRYRGSHGGPLSGMFFSGGTEVRERR